MAIRDFTANVISASKVVPDGNFKNSAASGVWDINEALDLIKGGNWPNAANIDPASFVDNLFSCDLWTSDGSSAQTITNNIDLSNKGGLVWIKDRSTSKANVLVDTARISGNTDNYLMSNSTSAQTAHSNEFGDFTSTGYTIPRNTEAGYTNTNTGRDYVGWTFRKQPKFFDIVTYTGDGNADRQINHNLGSVPGMMIVKKYAGSTTRWAVYHRSLGTGKFLNLDDTASTVTQNDHWQTAPNATQFTVETNGNVNNSGDSYVAYLFAHNDDDGGFGEPGDQDIIKCGSYTGNSNSTGPIIDLGFEPQWIVVKRASNTGGWFVIDTMRGLAQSGTNDPFLRFDSTQVEYENPYLKPLATGFQPKTTSSAINYSGDTYVYMAIRRGGMQTPSAASDVFQATASLTGDRQNGDTITTTLDHADWHFARRTGTSYAGYNQTRINGWKYLVTDATDVEASATLKQGDNNNKLEYTGSWHSADNDVIDYFWKRARGFFDVVVYEGPSSTGNISHNLGVVPEMIWVKNTAATENWAVYHKDLGNTYYLHLNTDAASSNTDGGNFWNSTTPTASVFSVGTSTLTSHYTRKHVAYLFASVSDVSKVGSYTGNSSSSQNIDCGFTTAGVEFLLIKSTSSGDWYVWDRLRGITSGNDPYIRFNNTAAETTNTDHIDTFSTGFTVNSDFNTENEVYIFYAIATG